MISFRNSNYCLPRNSGASPQFRFTQETYCQKFFYYFEVSRLTLEIQNAYATIAAEKPFQRSF